MIFKSSALDLNLNVLSCKLESSQVSRHLPLRRELVALESLSLTREHLFHLPKTVLVSRSLHLGALPVTLCPGRLLV